MSRLARNPIMFSDKISCNFNDNMLVVKGPKGERELNIPSFLNLNLDNNSIMLSMNGGNDKKNKNFPMLGTIRAIIVSAIKGVTDGFKVTLTLSGTGYKSSIEGSTLKLLLGYSHPIVVDIPSYIKVTCVKPVIIDIEGIDAQKVKQFASEVASHRKPIAYKGGEILGLKSRIKKEGKR
ncbi:50S ribosomal protein L6 [Candidatus Cytomitobacter indipagum]|uniref:50S ribosomal protein L6 n=1 Tax=Candidatus Cytomitobacter indipagum TaxID=2601575 RepID=A0A5C0UG40_9PROT|nr:50S ribosomal protein L6 [Candidatus Cytomitobacter indipagum]QEK38232.1 50S ribosomal protein L6 [Candidatus Cytomitobacter indipagum]